MAIPLFLAAFFEVYAIPCYMWGSWIWFSRTFINGYDPVPQPLLFCNLVLSPITFPVYLRAIYQMNKEK